jgi:VWFA-related protein
MRPLRSLLLTAILVLTAGAAGQEAEQPREADLTERVETRILQIDVSVIDRKVSARRSVPGLRKEMFRLRVDGKRLGAEAYARVGFDEICGETGLPAELDRRSLIVMADFNYLDGQMRWDTAEALRALADRGLPEGTRVKVVGFTRFLFEIQGFTDDPDDLRAAADFIASASGILGPGTTPFVPATTSSVTARALATSPPSTDAGFDPGARPPTASGAAPRAPAPAVPPEAYNPEDLPGGEPIAPQDPGGQGEGPSDEALRRLTEKLGLIPDLPQIDFGPSLSADPFRARVGTNPGHVPPESVLRETAWADPGSVASFQALDSMASLLASLVPPNTGRARVDRLGLWDHRASLAAIEAVLRGHAGVHGRKALVVFTGEEFSATHEDEIERDTAAVLEAAQGGFSLWLVDARGFHETFTDDERSESRLLTKLAKDTGGEPLRDAGDLSMVFTHAQEALDCYYLFSIPVAQSDEARTASVSVSLDTRRFKELFGYTVTHDARVRLHDQAERRELARTAALLSPGEWQTTPLRADLAFPLERDRRLSYLPVEVSVPLGSLDFRPDPDGGAVAEFLVDIAVDRNGLDAVCLIPPKGEATMRKVFMPRAPAPGFRGHLVIRNVCPYRGAGLYTVRAVLTEPSVEVPGGTHSLYRIDPRPGRDISLAALRAGHNTGQDYYLVDDGSERAQISRDRAQEAFVPLAPDEPAATDDRLLFRYVVCGPSREDAVERLRRVIYSRTDEGPRPLFLLPGSGDEQEPAAAAGAPFCVEVEDDLPPDTLLPGRYGFAVLAVRGEGLTRADLQGALETGEGAGLLGQIDFVLQGAGPRPAAGPGEPSSPAEPG